MATRLLFVTKTRTRGGTEKHLVDFIVRLDASLAEVIVLCLDSDLYSAYLQGVAAVKVVRPAGRVPEGLLSYRRTLSGHSPDIVVFVNSWLGLFPWYAYLAARASGAKRVMAIEHLLADPPERVGGTGIRNTLRRLIGYHARNRWRITLGGLMCHKTITVSDAVRERLIHGYGYRETKTITVRNGVDLKHYARPDGSSPFKVKQDLGFRATDRIILCISSLNAQKRLDVLLSAFSLVAPQHREAVCIILGSGDLESVLRRQAVQLGLESRVRFQGHVDDVRPYLEVADVFALSSDKEGLPLSLGEAMAYGVSSVVTDAGGNREIAVHGETGYIVEPGSPQELAKAIDYLLVHEGERIRMGENAKNRVQQYFDIEKSMRALRNELMAEI